MDNFFSRLVLSEEWGYRLGRHLMFWLACWGFMGFIYGFLYFDSNGYPNFTRSYVESFIYLPQHMVLSYGLLYLVLPKFVFKNKYWLGLLSVIMLILIAAILSPIIQKLAVEPLRTWLHEPTKNTSFFLSFMGGLRGSMTIAGFALAIKLVKHWYFKKVENEALEKEKLKAELHLLRGQLHPHFIFNTLNSIYSLALKKSDDTPSSILKLSDIIRYMFTDCSGNSISLKKRDRHAENLY